MPVVRRDYTFAANEIVENLIEGMPLAKVGRPSRVRLFAVITASTVLDLYFGSRQVLLRGVPNTQATAGPTLDDILVDDVALPGEDITLRAEETAGGTPTLRYRIEKNAIR